VFFNNIMIEVRACIYAKNAHDTSDSAAYDSAHRTCGALTFAGATVNTFGHTMG
jgi:hypothetical protein